MITQIDSKPYGQQNEQNQKITNINYDSQVEFSIIDCGKVIDQSTIEETLQDITNGTIHDTIQDMVLNLNPNDKFQQDKKQQSILNKSVKNNLAFAMAQRYPSKIKSQVTKMINYYEETLKRQRQMYHKLVQKMFKFQKDNHNLQNQKQNSSNDSNQQAKYLRDKAESQTNQIHQKNNEDLFVQKKLQLAEKRKQTLQAMLIEKDNKIVQLSRQNTELLLNYRKNKKLLKQKLAVQNLDNQ